jgi:hypothetical protein
MWPKNADQGYTLEFRRPLLSSVEHGDQFQALLPNAVGDYIRRIGHDKFACSEHSSRTAHTRLGLEKIDSMEDPESDERCALFRIFPYVLPERNKVAYRTAGPDDLHRGALVSPHVPHDVSHLETFSWLTA